MEALIKEGNQRIKLSHSKEFTRGEPLDDNLHIICLRLQDVRQAAIEFMIGSKEHSYALESIALFLYFIAKVLLLGLLVELT